MPKGGANMTERDWVITSGMSPILQEIKKRYPNSIMSGSGSTYFGINITFDNIEGFLVKNGLKAIPYGVKEV